MTDLQHALLLLVGALAVARITALIVIDGITEPIRHRIWLWSPPFETPGQEIYTLRYMGDVEESPAYEHREPGFVGKLIACHHCVGVWVAAGAVAAYHVAPREAIGAGILFALAQASDIAIKVAR
jgi:hypothetical protein